MAFSAFWQSLKFLFQDSDASRRWRLRFLFVMQIRNLFFMKLFFESADFQQSVA